MRLMTLAGLVIAAGMLTSNRAAAEEAMAPVHLHPHAREVTSSSPVSGKANVGMKFSFVEEVCLEFEFSLDNLLDAGDELFITVDGSDAGGFFNPGPEPQAARTLCWVPSFAPTIVADFLDGKAKLEFIATAGSVTLNSVTLTVSGSLR